MVLIHLVVMLLLLSPMPAPGEERGEFFVDADWSPIR